MEESTRASEQSLGDGNESAVQHGGETFEFVRRGTWRNSGTGEEVKFGDPKLREFFRSRKSATENGTGETKPRRAVPRRVAPPPLDGEPAERKKPATKKQLAELCATLVGLIFAGIALLRNLPHWKLSESERLDFGAKLAAAIPGTGVPKVVIEKVQEWSPLVDLCLTAGPIVGNRLALDQAQAAGGIPPAAADAPVAAGDNVAPFRVPERYAKPTNGTAVHTDANTPPNPSAIDIPGLTS